MLKWYATLSFKKSGFSWQISLIKVKNIVYEAIKASLYINLLITLKQETKMSESKIRDINARRDNNITINAQPKSTYKSLYQCEPHELRNEDKHIFKGMKNYRKKLISKSYKYFIFPIIGIIIVGAIAFLGKEFLFSYADGQISIRIIFSCITDISNAIGLKAAILYIAGFLIFVLLIIVFPALRIATLWFHKDSFLIKQHEKRQWINERLQELEP